MQQSGSPKFVHEDPVTKGKRLTDMAGAVVSAVEADPWGADTGRSSNAAFQPRRFASYERDANGSDEAMMRRYSRAQARFEQPDPYDGSYNLEAPQSLNRYSYVQNDPVNFIDPTGLDFEPAVPMLYNPPPDRWGGGFFIWRGRDREGVGSIIGYWFVSPIRGGGLGGGLGSGGGRAQTFMDITCWLM